MSDILCDTSKFVLDPKQKDNCKSLETSLSSMLNKLSCSGAITKQYKSYLLSSGHNVPRLYGLPKTHKIDIPLRPILSMSGSPTHRTASWLSKLLEPVRDIYGNYRISDSFEFVSKIRNLNVNDCKLVSFDVTSLFTSVPVYETIEIILSTIRDKQIDLGIDLGILRDLLLLCVTDVQFTFNGQFYRQIDGVAMGSCLGPLFADIFIGHLESQVAATITANSELFVRYVDDCCVVMKPCSDIDDLLMALNSVHPSITYTYETETNNTLNFLDVSCVRTPDGSVQTSVYRKPTWTGLYINFRSFVPRTYKVNLIKCLANRASKICSPECLNQWFLTFCGARTLST